jgi:hypothetical protein
MSAAEGGGGPAQAQGGSEREPVLEIYTQRGLEPYIMKPVGKGKEMFGNMDLYKAPQGKDRVKLHSELIAHGVLHPVLGDPDFEFLKEMPFDRSITMPHLNNPYFQLIKVFDNHKILDKLKSIYAESTAPVQSRAQEYCEEIRGMTYRPTRAIWSPEKRNDLRKISVTVANRVGRILNAAAEAAAIESNKELKPDEIEITSEFEAGDDAAAAEAHSAAAELGLENQGAADAAGAGSTAGSTAGQGGGSSRPSRKYKKSKRVLRRKSRSTRRR